MKCVSHEHARIAIVKPKQVKLLRSRYIRLEAETEQAWAGLEESRIEIKKIPGTPKSPGKVEALKTLIDEVLVVASLELERRHVFEMLMKIDGD